MDGATICVEPGTSTELAVNDYFRLSNIKFTPILIADLPEVQGASCPAVRVKVVAA
jgi:general L-amino acid transport system substrate-binding protein